MNIGSLPSPGGGVLSEEQSRLASLAAIVESTDDAVYGWDLDGTVRTWNQGAVRLYGYSADEVLGRRTSDLAPPDRRAESDAVRERIGRGEHVEPFDTERLRRDGGRVSVSLTISAVRDATGAVVGGATIARDLTGRRRAEAALQQTLSL